MKEECQNYAMHLVGFGKGEGFSNQSGQTLSQRAIETLDMVCVGFGVALGQLISSNHFGISFPDVSEAMGFFVGIGNRLP